VRVLVTGTSGFLGGALASDLLRKGHAVGGFDVRGAPPKGVAPFRGDLREAAAVREAFRAFRPEVVVHLAARTDLAETKDLGGYDANIGGVRNVVEAIHAGGTGRAIFASSQLVCRVGYTPSSDTDYAPSTLYGESKVLTERIVREANGGGVAWCLVRPTTVWGPGMSAHYRRFLGMIARGRYVHVGASPLLKSYGYVGNVTHQLARLLEVPAEAVHGKTLYLADEPPLSVRAWANAIQHEMGARPIRTIPLGLARALARVGDSVNAAGWHSFPFNSFRLTNLLTEYRFDLSETLHLCGPAPYTMEAGVRELVRWFRSL
jgi:nucleoside-diphosphate-sugar epimerase